MLNAFIIPYFHHFSQCFLDSSLHFHFIMVQFHHDTLLNQTNIFPISSNYCENIRNLSFFTDKIDSSIPRCYIITIKTNGGLHSFGGLPFLKQPAVVIAVRLPPGIPPRSPLRLPAQFIYIRPYHRKSIPQLLYIGKQNCDATKTSQ